MSQIPDVSAFDVEGFRRSSTEAEVDSELFLERLLLGVKLSAAALVFLSKQLNQDLRVKKLNIINHEIFLQTS